MSPALPARAAGAVHADPPAAAINVTAIAAPMAVVARSATADAAVELAPAAPAGLAAGPLPPLAAWKDATAFTVHGPNALETRRSAFGRSLLTPAERLFVRDILPTPDPSILDDRDAWTVEVAGVRQPRALSVRELKALGSETLAMVLQCSGNGRGMFASEPDGSPWRVGAAGCVQWRGVPVRAVAAALGGALPGLGYLTGTGGEPLPDGVDARTGMVERSVPAGAMEHALLAWEMNGEPIPLVHGGPLRLIVPGYTGVNQIKYVGRLAFTAAESAADIQRRLYRMTAPGSSTTMADAPVWEIGVKSWITGPLPDDGMLAAGEHLVHGVAFGGMRAVRRVDVSADGGRTWREAAFTGPDLGRYAWRRFELTVLLAPGTHTLLSRAEDAQGVRQPEWRAENVHGYGNNSWRDHAVRLAVD